MRLYFLHEHQWLTAFHKDYFLDDMLAGSTRCCLFFLVNVVLGVGLRKFFHSLQLSVRRRRLGLF